MNQLLLVLVSVAKGTVLVIVLFFFRPAAVSANLSFQQQLELTFDTCSRRRNSSGITDYRVSRMGSPSFVNFLQTSLRCNAFGGRVIFVQSKPRVKTR